MGKYFKTGYYPQNFILLHSPEHQHEKADQIVQEAFSLFPDLFNGNRKLFPFELRYVPPFDKTFNELKRLQGAAAEEAKFRDEYRGYIAVDLSAYLKHETEKYFEIAIKFFHDMNDCWKFIFLVDNRNKAAAMDLVRKILCILDDVSCGVIEEEADRVPTDEKWIRNACKEYGVTCSLSVFAFLQKVLNHKEYSRQLVPVLLREVSVEYGAECIIGVDTIKAYFSKGVPVIKYMLSSKLYDGLVAILEEVNEEAEYEKAV